MNQELLPDDLFTAFRALIYRTSGIHIPETKRVMLSNRLRRRLSATGAAGFAEYFDRLRDGVDREEFDRFIDAFTTRETYFFRDDHHFRWLADRFAPELVDRARKGNHGKSMSLWSAACSGGEELYSALIALAEAHHPPSGWTLRALGTDISEAALESARSASFGDRSLRAVGPEVLRRWFVPDAAGGRRTLRDEVRRRVTFRRHNLLEPMRDGPFDCIFLKNVLIYFDQESKAVVVPNVIDALAPGGYLVVGPTEGIFSMLDPLERVEGWLYRRPGEG
jgi:chemotaxis protein methyltransferase CheR